AIVERLLDQTLTFGLLSKKVEHRELECQLLMEDNIILIVPAGHPWAQTGKITPADLPDQPFIRREEPSGTNEGLAEALKEHKISLDLMNVAMEMGNAEMVEMAVERGLGVGFVSELVAARGLALGRIKKVEVENLQPVQPIYLCRRSADSFTRAETSFWEFAHERREQIRGALFEELARLKRESAEGK
ncbi:MAG TPA: LysR substrate-binding domain-containing protein, partial [Pseudomonadales bacterium]|nr:LysR substrate-binding domain-containing protein [Pseudomonadales bacterium]